jgi:hypothetical protein
MLDKAGVKYVYFASPGTTPEWLTLRRDLIDLASRLFRQLQEAHSSNPTIAPFSLTPSSRYE